MPEEFKVSLTNEVAKNQQECSAHSHLAAFMPKIDYTIYVYRDKKMPSGMDVAPSVVLYIEGFDLVQTRTSENKLELTRVNNS